MTKRNATTKPVTTSAKRAAKSTATMQQIAILNGIATDCDANGNHLPLNTRQVRDYVAQQTGQPCHAAFGKLSALKKRGWLTSKNSPDVARGQVWSITKLGLAQLPANVKVRKTATKFVTVFGFAKPKTK